MSYAEIVFAIVPAAPPTWKKRRATSCPAPISANVPYRLPSRLIWNAFLFVPRSISAFMRILQRRSKPPNLEGPKYLQPNASDTLGRDPAAQIIWQRRVNPIATLADDFHLAAGREREHGVRRVCGRYSCFHGISRYHGQCAAFASVLE